jgi:hypothetical protein
MKRSIIVTLLSSLVAGTLSSGMNFYRLQAAYAVAVS